MSLSVVHDPRGPMRHTVRVRDHELTVDALPAGGGEDAGPDPHDLYDAALGACKALTVLWYARRKQTPVESVEVAVERDAEGAHGGVYQLVTRLRVTGTLSETERSQLLAVAAKCPVQRLMTEVRTEIETRWQDD